MVNDTKKLIHLNPQAENGFDHIIPIEEMFDVCFEDTIKFLTQREICGRK